MKNLFATGLTGRTVQNVFLVFLAAALSVTCVSPAAAQKEKKQKKDKTPADTSKTLIPMSDEQQIDYMLSEMLGAWQLGDIEKLHKYYADDVSIVNGGWAAPILGWTNYLALYQQQLTRMQKVRMDRANTYIKVSGTVGWACYQWDFEAVVDGQPSAARGQTTVVVEKRNNQWLIVHNHTSLVQNLTAPAPGSTPTTPQQNPTKPAAR
ncbi:MAG TPA: nuclear transport factor 2 family protein [Candidatus Acidoferrum sp.]|nr:nuclear transport factor 2 family protein [Candidatus Acidoferrum sp.]